MLFLINLDSAFGRRRHMTSQLEALGVDFERLGVDMRTSSNDEISAWVEAHFPNIRFDLDNLSGAEVGCWLSHLSAWQGLLRHEHARTCTVIEDDLILDGNFADAVRVLESQDAFDLVYLGTSSRNLSTKRRTRIGRLWVHEPVGTVFNTWGYSITRRYVERFFADNPLRLDVPIDHFVGGNARRAKPRVGVLRPAIVEEDPTLGVASQIEPYTNRLDRWRPVEMARRRLLSSPVSQLYYSLYRLL